MADPTYFIEQYELKICSAIRQIMEVEKMIEQKKKIKTYSKKNPEKIVDAVIKLQNARFELENAMKCLLDAGDRS
jgi:hypothetical protein